MSEDPGDGEDGDDDVPERIRREGRIPDFVQEHLLDHPVRERIIELLEERPGMNKRQICDEVDGHSNVVNHHLNKLEDGQLIVIRPSAQEKEMLCFRVEDAILWEDDRTRIMFGRKESRAVGLYLAENPGATTRKIADALRLSPVTVRHHLRTLKEHELVHQHPAGQTYLYEPAQVLTEWVEEVGDGFERPWEG